MIRRYAGAHRVEKLSARVVLWSFLILCLPARQAFGRFAPLGPVFKVNSSSASDDVLPQILALEDGGFVVTWEGPTDMNMFYQGMVYGQRFDDRGAPIGTEFVLTGATGGRDSTSLGESLVVTRYIPGPTLNKFAADGSLQGTYADPEVPSPSTIATTAGDEIGLTWIDVNEVVHLQRFDADLNPIGPSFIVGQQDPANTGALAADLAGGPDGRFIVTWYAEDSLTLWGRVFDAADLPLGDQFPIAAPADVEDLLGPEVCADQESGSFVVGWNDQYRQPAAFRRFDPDGTPRTAPLCAGFDRITSVSCSAPDRVILAGRAYDSPDGFVSARAIDGDNTVIGNLLMRVSSPRSLNGPIDTLALANGSVVFAWGECPPSTGIPECDVYAQLFQLTDEPECLGDCDQNGVVDVAELVTGVDIALHPHSTEFHPGIDFIRCGLMDGDLDRQVSISELVGAVNNALSGCP